MSHAIFRERVIRARQTPLAEKFLAGAELFEGACEVTRCGIRAQHPDWSLTAVEAELARRLGMQAKLVKEAPVP